MMQFIRRVFGYCPHPPLGEGPDQGMVFYGAHWLSMELRDFASSVDGLVGFTILYGLLFLASFVALPLVGSSEEYQLVTLRVVSAISLTIALLYLYSKSRSTSFLSIGGSGFMQSLTESLLALVVWGGLLLLFGTISGSYYLAGSAPGHWSALPISILVGVLGGLIVFGYSAPKFEKGMGTLLAIILSSTIGALLFFAVSMDYPFVFLPITILMVYVGLRTGSAIGPIVATSLLFGVFSILQFSPFPVGFFQPTYGSIIAALISGPIVAIIHSRLAGMAE